jgi:ribosomal protein S6--L-glutamate ligase
VTAIWFLTDQRYLEQRMPMSTVAWLRERGHEVRVLVAEHERVHVLARTVSSAWDRLDGSEVVVCRSRHPFALALLDVAGRRGAAVLTPWEAVSTIRDKARCAALLADHGVPAPETFLAATPAGLTDLGPERFPLVLKPHLGDNGDGVTVVAHPEELRRLSWDDDLVLAQRWIETGGWDVKVYVCGDQVWAVRRPSPLSHHPSPIAFPQPVTPELRRIALTCRDAFELPLCGVDVAFAAEGPLVMDVNEFPNYTGVPDAPEAIGRLIEASLERCPDLTMAGG